jgi:glycosyltransferase involved in cell wall biosynthesis
MIGDGTLRADLAETARELGISDRIVFAGNRDQFWLSRVLPRATAILAPLSGRSLGEAALSGTPVIAYDVDWHGEIIESGVTGELVPCEDVEAMTDATARILDAPAYGKRIGAAARQWMLDRMHPSVVNEQQKLAYDKLLARKLQWLKRTS